MSLYNQLFGTNPFTRILVQVLDLGTEWKIGRFRDIYVKAEEGDPVIVLFTRNGGGNRECYCEPLTNGEVSEDKHEDGCLWAINQCLTEHPNYLRDYDDSFDSTYASFEFRTPEKFKELICHIQEVMGSEKPPMERFEELIAKLQAGNREDPDVQRAMKVGKEVFGKIKKAFEGEGPSIIEV